MNPAAPTGPPFMQCPEAVEPAIMNPDQATWLAQLAARPNRQDRLNWLVEHARSRQPLPPELKTERQRVDGCLARLWLVTEYREGRCWFRCDSESLIVKAVAGCLCDYFSGLTPAEIAASGLAPLQQAGLDDHLTPNRRDALSRVWERIQHFARAMPGPASPASSAVPAGQAGWCDAHNHLQDERFGGRQAELVAACQTAGVVQMVVNGAAEADWTAVAELARAFPSLVVPSFGCHPWYLAERSSGWRERLERFLDENPASAVGEIGLDRWKPGLDYAGQEEVLLAQLELAAAGDRPASIHCLQAWGRLLELLNHGPKPDRGFLLHSYGGPVELIVPLARLGAYFGFPGYFLHARKARQCEVFRVVPPDRLLVETDAPDQRLPAEATEFPLAGTGGAALNHPANLGAVYRGLAVLLEEPVAALARRVAANFTRLFGPRPAGP